MSAIWEQQKGEPDEAYARFLFYRNLGPTRSLDAAYEAYNLSGEAEDIAEKGLARVTKGIKRWKAPGQWQRDSTTYQWEYRANQWDIEVLSQAGRVVIDSFYKSLGVMASQLLELIQSGLYKPKTYTELLEGLGIIGSFVSPEAVAAWRDFASSYSPAPIDEPDPGDTDQQEAEPTAGERTESGMAESVPE